MDKEILLGLYPGYTSVLGPYHRPDGRQHVILNNSKAPKGTKGKTKTISYPKALKEIELKQKLEPNETIDHHDRDFTNDDLNNLKVKPLNKHASEDALRVMVSEINCPICQKLFTPNVNQRNEKDDKAGPFCSKSCAGKYGTSVQNGQSKIKRNKVIKSYYKINK